MSMFWNIDPIRELRQRIRVRTRHPRDKGQFPVVGYRYFRVGGMRKNTAFVDRGWRTLRVQLRAEDFCMARGCYPMRRFTNHPKERTNGENI